jgi:hypothetical protein
MSELTGSYAGNDPGRPVHAADQLMPDLRVHELVFCAGYLALGRASDTLGSRTLLGYLLTCPRTGA